MQVSDIVIAAAIGAFPATLNIVVSLWSGRKSRAAIEVLSKSVNGVVAQGRRDSEELGHAAGKIEGQAAAVDTLATAAAGAAAVKAIGHAEGVAAEKANPTN